jgi:nucleotide-binding universal stress UspA family protein
MSLTRPPVVVGVDGSTCDELAVEWAADEASTRHLPVRVVHVLDPPVMSRSLDLELTDRIMAFCAEQAREIVDRAVARAGRAAAGIEVSGTVVTGDVVPALLAVSDGARLVVLGSGGRFDAGRARLGSVAAHVSAHGQCPVIVARMPEPGEPPSGLGRERIVVGVDGSAISESAVGFAFEEAAWRGLGLTVVHAWQEASLPLTFDVPQPSAREQMAERVIAEAAAGWSEKYPEVQVSPILVRDHPVRALINEAAGATLLVVGSHGRGRFSGMVLGGMVLGSVSQAMLRHASTSIAIVRNLEARNR